MERTPGGGGHRRPPWVLGHRKSQHLYRFLGTKMYTFIEWLMPVFFPWVIKKLCFRCNLNLPCFKFRIKTNFLCLRVRDAVQMLASYIFMICRTRSPTRCVLISLERCCRTPAGDHASLA